MRNPGRLTGRSPSARSVALFVALALVAAACGGDDATGNAATPTSGTTVQVTTATTEPVAGSATALAECVASLVPGSSAVHCEGADYDLSIPEECFATPCGLIVDFHPSGLTGEQTDAYTNMKALGNSAGYVVVQPNSPSSATYAGRNRIFFDALIGALDIDVSRVHVGGASSGGSQAWRFVCEHADLIASAAPHASSTAYCVSEENEQVDILMLHGRKDSQTPFAQGVTTLELVIESWGMTASEVLADEPTYQWTRWTNEQGTVLEFVEFDWTTPTGEGHCYPGGVGRGGCGIDTPIHYGEAALAFYIAHPKDD